MRGSFRFAWAAGIAFFLGWAVGAPDPGVPLPVTAGRERSPVVKTPSLLTVDLIRCRLASTGPCQTRYGKWIWEVSDTESIGTGFRMQNVFIDDARYRKMTAEQFKAECAGRRPGDFLDRDRFCLPDSLLEALSGSVFHALPFAGLSFTYEDEQLREWSSDGVTAARLLEILNRIQIRESLLRRNAPEASAPPGASVPDVSPAGTR